IAVLIEEHGVRAEKIFAVTFTNKAAGEMKLRVATLLARDPAGLWIGTFHSLSARMLRRDAERLGFSRQFTIFDEDDRLALIRRLLEERNFPPKLFPPRAVQAIISSAKNRMLGAEQLAAQAGFDRLTQIAAELMGPLAAALRRQNAMDFDDLMLHPLTLFAEHPDRLAWWRRTRRSGGESVTVVAAADERDEAEWIARELSRRSAAGEWPLEAMAVLYRTNAQSRALEEACRRAGVAYRVVGAISFYERREVKDLIAYLRLVANPLDDEAFLRAVGVPRRGIGDASLEVFRGAAAG